MKTFFAFLLYCLPALCLNAQDRIGFIDAPDTSEMVYLRHFRGFGGEVWFDYDRSLIDSVKNDYYPLGDYTFIRQWYLLKNGVTVELVFQKDSSWLYVQKRADKTLFYGESVCREIPGEHAMVANSKGEDSLVPMYQLVQTGMWHYFYPNGQLEGNYKEGKKTGEWIDFRNFQLEESDVRTIYAFHQYSGGKPDSSFVFSLMESDLIKSYISNQNWAVSTLSEGDYLVFNGLDYIPANSFSLLKGGKTKLTQSCGVGGIPDHPLSWRYDEKKNLLLMDKYRYTVLFINDTMLIVKRN